MTLNFKKLVVFIFTVAAIVTVKGQTWNLAGSSPTSTEYFGTTSNDDIRVCTNNGGSTFNAAKQKMLITSGGNIGIGYDGTNTPATPTNKLLIQNGSLSSYDPYNALYDLNIPASSIGLYSISKGASSTNVPILVTAVNDGVQNIGIAINTGGTGSTNIGTYATISNGDNNIGTYSAITSTNNNTGSIATINGDNGDANVGSKINVTGDDATVNRGASIDIVGNNTPTNHGIDINIEGDYATDNEGIHIESEGLGCMENQGIGIFLNTPAIDNNGIIIQVSEGTRENLGVHIEALGTGASINTGVYALAADADTLNVGANINATGPAITNQAFSATAANATTYNNAGNFIAVGDDAVQNRGLLVVVQGDNHYANTGMVMNVLGEGNNYNTGIKMNLEDEGEVNTGIEMSLANATDHNVGISLDISGATLVNTGIVATAQNATDENLAADFSASGNAPENTGLFCTASDGSILNVGIHAIAQSDNGTDNYGIVGDIAGSGSSSINYGIVGSQPSGTASGTNAPTNGSPSGTPSNFAGYFNGDVFSSDTYYYSDERLKDNIKDYEGALAQLGKLPVKQYTFKNEKYPYMNMPKGVRTGVLSSDLKKVFPNLVKGSVYPGKLYDRPNVTYEAVNYNGLIPVLIQAIKEVDKKTTENKSQEERIEKLEKQIVSLSNLEAKYDALEKLVNDICSTGCGIFIQSDSLHYDRNRLFQNSPNPFSKETNIEYYLTQESGNSFIAIFNSNGAVIQQFNNLKQGKNSITFNSEVLTGGSYFYSLFVQGIKVDSKVMAIVKR